MKLKEIIGVIGGELRGSPETEISGFAGVADARPGQLTFLTDAKLSDVLMKSGASCVIVKDFIDSLETAQIKSPDPYYSFAVLLHKFSVKKHSPKGVSQRASVSIKATIGADVTISDFAFIGDYAEIGGGTHIYPNVYVGEGSTIGKDCIIYPNVTIREGVRIGDRVILHPGAVIGADGFGFIFREGRHFKIPQVGGVDIGNDVEIGANSCVDRAMTGTTAIGDGTKMDNLMQIAHNVKIGRHCVLAAQTAVGGSAVVGDYVVVGGHVAISDHAKIEDEVMIAGKSGVHGTLEKGVYSGIPAIRHRVWLRASTLFGKLPELFARVKELEEKNIGRSEKDA